MAKCHFPSPTVTRNAIWRFDQRPKFRRHLKPFGRYAFLNKFKMVTAAMLNFAGSSDVAECLSIVENPRPSGS